MLTGSWPPWVWCYDNTEVSILLLWGSSRNVHKSLGVKTRDAEAVSPLMALLLVWAGCGKVSAPPSTLPIAKTCSYWHLWEWKSCGSYCLETCSVDLVPLHYSKTYPCHFRVSVVQLIEPTCLFILENYTVSSWMFQWNRNWMYLT